MTTRTVGRYELLRQVGRGGMAVVHLARQRPLERFVALKELRSVGLSDPAAARRFLRESRLAGSLSHANIVTVHDYFEWDGTAFIAMEYLSRGALRPWVGRLSPAEAVGVLVGLLGALAAAERERIVHRDLKPENIMVTREGSVKIADFGIARALGNALPDDSATATGMTIGTPSYMAPEQALAQPIGPWTDLYSTGVIAFELLSGRLPFVEPVPAAMLLKHINEEAPPLSSVSGDVEPALSDWVGRLLSKEPDERPQSALLAGEELEELALGLFGPRWRRDATIPPDETPPTSSFARPSPTQALGVDDARRAAAEANITAWRQTAERRRIARGEPIAAAGIAAERREAMGDGAAAGFGHREAVGDGAAAGSGRREAMGDDAAAFPPTMAPRRESTAATSAPRQAPPRRRRPLRSALLLVALFVFAAGAIATLFAPRNPARPASEHLTSSGATTRASPPTASATASPAAATAPASTAASPAAANAASPATAAGSSPPASNAASPAASTGSSPAAANGSSPPAATAPPEASATVPPVATVDPDLSGVGDSRSDDPSDDEPDGDNEP